MSLQVNTETQALDWLIQQLPSEITPPSRLEIDEGWKYLNRKKTCGYRADRNYSASGNGSLHVTFNSFKGGGYTSHLQLWDNQTSLERSFQRAPSRLTRSKQRLAQRRRQSVRYDLEELWPQILSSIPNQSQQYLEEKGIPLEWLGDLIRFGNDADHPFISPDSKRGDYLAIQFRSALDNRPCHLQRIYSDKSKRMTWGSNKDQAPCVVLSRGPLLDNSEPIHFTESITNAAVLHRALKQPVVATSDANNMSAVVTAFRQRFPHRPGYTWVDNDQWKYDHADNTGILKGIKAARAANYQVVIPQFDDYDCSNQPTDLCDLYQLGGLQALRDLYKSASSPLTGYQWQKQRLNYIGLRKIKGTTSLKPFYSAINQLCRSALTQTPLRDLEQVKEEIVQLITAQRERIPSLPIDLLVNYAQQYLTHQYQKKNQAAIKRISQAILNQVPKVKTFEWELDSNGKERIPAWVCEEMVNSDQGLDVVLAPKDRGKTDRIIKPSIERAKKRQRFPTIITPLIGLTRDASSKCQMVNYQDIIDGRDATTCDSLAVTVNSIIKPRLQPILQWSRELYADEIDTIFDAITVGTVSDLDREETLQRLQELIQQVDKAVVASADIDDLCLEQLLKFRGDVTIYLPADYHPQSQAISTLLADKTIHVHSKEAILLKNIIDFVSQGHSAALACDHVRKVHNLVKLAKKKGINALEISKKTIHTKEVRAFFDNPSEEAKKYQLIAYTPSLGTGVSIDVPHLERVYAIYNRETTVDSFLQMLFRSRPTLEYHLAFPSPTRPPRIQPTFDDLKEEILKTAKVTFKMVGNRLPEIELSDFDVFRLRTLEQLKKERNPNDVLRRLIAEGAQLIYHSEETPQPSVKSELNQLSQEEQASTIQAVIEQGSQLTVETATSYLNQVKEPPSTEEKHLAAQIVQHHGTINEDLVTFWLKKGYQKCQALESALASPSEALNLDSLELQCLPLTLLNHNRIRQLFNRFLLYQLQLVDEKSNLLENPKLVVLSKDDLGVQQLIAQIWKHRVLFNGARLGVKITSKTLNKPIQFLRNWLGTLGISIKRLPRASANGSRQYAIDYELIKQRLVPILQRRRLEGQSSLKDKWSHYQNYNNSKVTDNWWSNLYITNRSDVSTIPDLDPLV